MQKLLVQRHQGLTAAVRFVRGARLIVRTRVLDRWSLDAGGGLKREPVSAPCQAATHGALPQFTLAAVKLVLAFITSKGSTAFTVSAK